jgi:hypothetical protein
MIRVFGDYKIVIHINEVHGNGTHASEQFLCLFTNVGDNTGSFEVPVRFWSLVLN